MEIYIVISVILTVHFIGDFMLQSDYVAKNKSKKNMILIEHVIIYMLPFMLIISPLYGLINGILHFCIDYITSRRSGELWARGDVHGFFVIIGLDQLLHAMSLIWTYYFLIG